MRRFGSIFLIFVCIAAFLLAGGSAFADEEEIILDSFAVKSEYREIVESAELLEKLKTRSSFYDETVEYAVMYDNIIAEFQADSLFQKRLKSGKINFENAAAWDPPTLIVPIVDAKTGKTVTYAELYWIGMYRKYGLSWTDLQGDMITKEVLDARLGIEASHYTLMVLDIGMLAKTTFVFAEGSDTFYNYSSVLYILDEGKAYTAKEVSEYIGDVRAKNIRRNLGDILSGIFEDGDFWIFLGYLALGVLPIVLVTVVIIVWIEHRKRKKTAPSDANDTKSDDTIE